MKKWFVFIVMTIDAFFMGYAYGLNSRTILVEDPSLPALKLKTAPPATKAAPAKPAVKPAAAKADAKPAAKSDVHAGKKTIVPPKPVPHHK